MTDIVERLRGAETCRESGRPCRAMDARSGCCCAAAADEIERLRAANDKVCSMLLDAAIYAETYRGKSDWASNARVAVADARSSSQQRPETKP